MSVEPRYNLATKVMSNGVEVIVAGDRKTRPGEPEFLRLLSSTVTRPITLAPHTLSNHMSMMLPADLQTENEVIPPLQPINQFSTKTYHTTFIFPTSVVHGTKTQTITESTVATNVREVNNENSQLKSSQVVTLSASPVFESQVHKTVYTFLNTVLDEDQPLVATSKHTVSNTVLALFTTPELQPSELFPETNTYYATREFTRTLTDGTDSQIVSTTDVVTQVVVTDPAQTEIISANAGTIDVTKTYFITYTYFSTLVDGESTKVTSHVSVSSDVTVEKFLMKNKKTMAITPTPAPLNVIGTQADISLAELGNSEQASDLSDVTGPNGAISHIESNSEKNPIVATGILKDRDNSSVTVPQGDIVDEWFEQHKVKPTNDNDSSKNKLKVKTTLKHKSRTKSVTKTGAVVAPTSSYTTSIVLTSSVTPQGATLLPGDQVIVLRDETGTKTVIPVTDPAKKKPKNGTEVQVSDMLSLGALGINSINVLGPVFHAMADLLKSHSKEALKRRNDTVPMKKVPITPPNIVNDKKTPAEVNNQKTTTSRIPVYIPVGSLAEDAEPSESEGRIAVLPTPEKWVQEKFPDAPVRQLDKNRRTHDTNPNPLLEGGIPISPGQVITTNSDVIIGRPSDSGPRPPNFVIKDNLPIDMKPPPVIEEQRLHHIDSIGQFSTNQAVGQKGRPMDDSERKPPSLPHIVKPIRPPKPLVPHSQSQVPQRYPHRQQQKQQHIISHQSHHQSHDSGDIDLNPPPPPPSIQSHGHHPGIIPIPVHLNPDEIVKNYVNPVQMHQDHVANNIIPTPTIPREMSVSKVMDSSNGRPLLVNIQPSQVAQVVIPHGSSTALIMSDQQQHSTKGEVIDDPSPHPEPETVGFVGAEPVLKIENSEIPVRHVNTISEMIKAEVLIPNHYPEHQQKPQLVSGTSEREKVHIHPDYDHIDGMQPPSAPLRAPVSNSKKDPSGIYVDISPPGHLPPPQSAKFPIGTLQQPQRPPPENLANHQSGMVHDVPLNAQVQLGSRHPSDVPVSEVLVSINHDNPSTGLHNKDESYNFIHQPNNDIPENLAPPPLPSVRPHGQVQLLNPGETYHSNQGRPMKYPIINTPADFMTPPPAPNYGKPIPMGPINQNSHNGEVLVMRPSDYNNDDEDLNDPLHTEDGEEIQESHARPLFPGQLPTEVENLLNNKTSRPIAGGIGVSQTLSFASSSDKQEQNSVPGVREPETIVGSQMPSAPGPIPMGFNNNNEAVVSVGKKPNLASTDVDLDEAEKMFGSKLPPKIKLPVTGYKNATDDLEINEVLAQTNKNEVVGMSPPPFDIPRRPIQRPLRPKPPFKFDMQSPTAPGAPVNVEVDFPPVRSPDLNKKPFKPEDVFPPRLPENFIPHEMGSSNLNRRPVVTSMPIDSPTSTSTESSSDVNGHSKPIIMSNTTESATTNRPKPVIYERPPHIHMQKPTAHPPLRQHPSNDRIPNRGQQNQEQQPLRNDHSNGMHQSSRDTPTRTQPPYPFDRQEAPNLSASNFGDKVRNPLPPSRGQPPRGHPPSSFEKPPNRGPPSYVPLHTNFEKIPNRGPPMVGQPSGFEKPPHRGSPNYDQSPPRGQPPARRPFPPRGQHPTSFEHQSASIDQSHSYPRPLPTGFDVPLARPSVPEYERPPPRGQIPSVFEEKPPRRPLPSAFETNPPKRIEPSPHFENQPAQGQPFRKPSQPEPVLDDGSRKPNPPQKRPVNEQADQIPEPTSVYTDRNEGRPFEVIPQLANVNKNEPPVLSGSPSENGSEKTISQKPTSGRPIFKPSPTVKPANQKPTVIHEDIQPSPTPSLTSSIPKNIVTTMVTSGSTTIFGDLYTEPLLLQPTKIYPSSQGVHFTVGHYKDYGASASSPQKIMVVSSHIPTHVTTTLTVTSTLTTVVQSDGQSPSTRTVLLTTTIISTIVDKVTETETLLRPTTSTITQTHTISTTKTALVVPTAIYPPLHKYPQAKPEIFVTSPHDRNPKPEIFVANPHDKAPPPDIIVAGDPRDKDTMTISVSSSMNKKDHKDHKEPIDNESILVVVTDKPPPKGKHEGAVVLGAGVLSPPAPPPFLHPSSQTECLPECRPARNELCVKQEGLMKCVCRPGFARMFPDQPCKPTYTYSMQLSLDRRGDAVHYQQGLQVPGSPKYNKMAESTKEGLNRMIMQSDLRDIYHGVAVTGFMPKEKKTMVDFYVQLSENIEEGKVLGVFKKSLRSSNFSLGGTEMFAARESNNLHIQDFNECLNPKFHDCSEHSRCFNLKGTYTCSCKEGYTDISENPIYPGRLCSDMIGCEYCGYHGTCYTRNDQQTCECFQWYSGDRCRINLKVLLIALVTIGAILLALLLVCVVMTCLKRRSSSTSRTNGSSGYLRYRGPPQAMDKRAMIVDTSSESSVENLPYVSSPPPPPLPQPQMGPQRKPVLRQMKRPAPKPQPQPLPVDRDRSLTVMIPRVKYRAVPPVSPHVTMSTFSPDKHLNRTAQQMDVEQKLLNYLDGGSKEREGSGHSSSQRPSKEDKRAHDVKPNSSSNTKREPRVFEYEYKTSNMHITDGTSSGERRSKDDRFRRYSDQTPLHHDTNNLHNLQHRKYSAGALVSAGYAVSATGGLIHDVEESTIHSNTLKSNRSQFTTLNRCGDHKTMSEARSYDETLIQPQTRPLCTNYSGSNSSRLNPDENHTMVERDLGSTFLLPESHLFKPAGDRGSDISNFDSL